MKPTIHTFYIIYNYGVLLSTRELKKLRADYVKNNRMIK